MRSIVGEIASTSPAGAIAKWLLVVFAAGVLAFLSVPASVSWSLDDFAEMLGVAAFVPWFVGPAALAALLVARAKSRMEAWAFVGAEAAAVASTALLWTILFINANHANSESTVTLIALPLFQFLAVLIYALGVLVIALFAGRTASVSSPDADPRTIRHTDGRIASIFIIAIALLIVGVPAYFLFH